MKEEYVQSNWNQIFLEERMTHKALLFLIIPQIVRKLVMLIEHRRF